MTSIIETRTNEFKFIDDQYCINNIDDLPYYILKISVVEKLYENGNRYYYIDYNSTFNESSKISTKDNNNNRINANPFKENQDNAEGVIVIKNDLTAKMVDFLLMNDEDLNKFTGFTTVQQYRILIINSLALFWD